MSKSTAFLLLGTVVLISCRAREIKPDERIRESPSSTEVLASAAGVYANLNSYQDEGLAVTKFEGNLRNHSNELHFTTAWSRSGNFRFEFRKPDVVGEETRYVVWKNGNEVKSWSTPGPQVESHKDISYAIAGATGVSGGTAYTIPSVLMSAAAWKGDTWTSPDGTYRIRDGVEGGTACFRIQRPTSTGSEKVGDVETPATAGVVTYWVTKDRFLLVRIDEETKFASFVMTETVKYSPKINSPISNAALEFGH